MRLGLIAVSGLLLSFSLAACQKPNEDFMGNDGESSPDTNDDTNDDTTSASNDDATTNDSVASTTPSSDTSATDEGTTDASASTGDTVESSTGASDDAGPCPAPEEELCGGSCIDVTSDHDNCGMCGHKCHPVMQTCEDSSCVPV
jgi:hypothetical protein